MVLNDFATVLIGCKDKNECKIKINDIKKHNKHIVRVHETIPFTKPLKLGSPVKAGNADFVIEVRLDKHVNIDDITEVFAKNLKTNLQTITVYQ